MLDLNLTWKCSLLVQQQPHPGQHTSPASEFYVDQEMVLCVIFSLSIDTGQVQVIQPWAGIGMHSPTVNERPVRASSFLKSILN